MDVQQKRRCVHCLMFFDKLTHDHILPKSYYQNLASVNAELWTAPACEKCNYELGKIEEDLLLRLGLCLNPTPDSISSTSEISQRILRSCDPTAARNERDRGMRVGRAKKILKNIFPSKGATKGLFPNFGYHTGWKPEEQSGILIPANEVRQVGEKIIRGIEYKLDGRYIEPCFKLEVHICEEDKVSDVSNLIRQRGLRYDITQGFEFYRFLSPDKNNCLYEIRIWDKFVIYGSLMIGLAFTKQD